MIKRILLVAVTGSWAAHAGTNAGPREIAYQGEAAEFRAQLDAGKFSFFDGRATQTSAVRGCNETFVRVFWADLVAHAEQARRQPAPAADRGATLKIDGAEVAVGRYDALYYYFNRTPREALVVLVQGMRACHD